MMTPDILSRIKQAGIQLQPLPDGRIRAMPKSALTDDLRDLIRRHRADILAALDHQHRVNELAVALRLYADRNGFSEEDFLEAMRVAVESDLDSWIAYIHGQNEVRH